MNFTVFSKKGCSYCELSTPIFICILMIDQFFLILSSHLLEINIGVDTSQYDHPCIIGHLQIGLWIDKCVKIWCIQFYLLD